MSKRHSAAMRWRAFMATVVVLTVAMGCTGGSTEPRLRSHVDAGPAAEKSANAPFILPSLAPDVPARRENVAPLPVREGPEEDAGLVNLGRSIFADDRYSQPPGTSCASCHDPKRAFAGNHGAKIGVAEGSRRDHFAKRATPSVLYLKYVPKFHYFEDDEAAAPSPFGGFFWDGRADTIAELVQQPLFNPEEMNAGDASQLARKIVSAPYVNEFRTVFGAAADPKAVLRGFGKALEAYLTSDEMTPASSKFDAYVRGEATLSPLEKRGFEAFKDQRRGACAGCHRVNETSTNPVRTMFTDYGYDAVGVPRNRQLPATKSATYFDLGLCERKSRATPSNDEKLCGSFRTPSLRNVAVRESFMHNGRFQKLRDVVAFYATRSTAPHLWYPPGDKFDDLPTKHRENVNVVSLPYNRPEGAPPAMTDEDIDAVVAFLETLTDTAYLQSAP